MQFALFTRNTFKSHVPAHFGRRRLQESILVLDPLRRAGYQCIRSIKPVSTEDASLKDGMTSTGRVWVAGCYSKKGKGKKKCSTGLHDCIVGKAPFRHLLGGQGDVFSCERPSYRDI